jgi:LmbE family N-acetylglucosaminyl deacetylase
MAEFIKKVWSSWGRVILVIGLLLAVMVLTWQLTLPDPGIPVTDLKPFSLNGYHRMIIFAPHCDDETLGSAGLILAAQRAGIQVRVVIATNGDGFMFATIRDFKKIYPRPTDYIHLGELRQQESLAALAVLGLKPDQVDFLSYPDRGSPALWDDHWTVDHPYRSPYSGDTRSPYTITYNPRSVYAGVDYLTDVSSILKTYQPDLIVYPHPDDVHPDHWGLNAFVRLAITLINHADPTFRPAEYTYLVHRPDYPEVKGLKPQAGLTPPVSLYALSHDWFRWDLTTADVKLKGQAVQKYLTQLPLLRGLMVSFVRANELFAPVQDANLVTLVQGESLYPSTWVDANGQPVKPVQLDPAGDFVTRSALPAADLVAVYAARDMHNNLLVCVQARENTAPEVIYSLRLKALTTNGIVAYLARTGVSGPAWQTAHRSGHYACASVSLVELGNPWAIFVGANVVGGGRVVDEAAWQMVTVERP